MSGRIEKILVANRGEIACRIIRSARAKGIATVAVYSDADRDALHVAMADESVRIGPPPVPQSYLKGDHIIEAALRTGADAVHPGYGFLSENASFAEAVSSAGLVFIGPSPEAIRAMGDKAEAKQRMIEAGVPCVPGYQGGDQSEERLLAAAREIGFPVMLKASAGGGGRGMRLVAEEAAFARLLRTARSEAQNAFGDERMLIEKAVVKPRHIEIQIFGDAAGNLIHLAERDCSIQRRHQKIVEEAPSPGVTPRMRKAMGEAAIKAAAALAYQGAGTVEFLLDADGSFYFLEMNTRLQVEHPVTELITGLDLVSMQIDVAEGLPLPLSQDEVTISGHAIEVRLYAEDPVGDFMPQTGRVKEWIAPQGPGVRVDHGLRAGTEVSAFYDPMLAKIIAWGKNREEARRRLLRALADTRIFGLTNNRSFLMDALAAQTFIDGKATTAFIEETYPDGYGANEPPADYLKALAAAWFCRDAAWRNNRWSRSRVKLTVGEGEPEWFAVEKGLEEMHVVSLLGERRSIALLSAKGGVLHYREANVTHAVPFHATEDEIVLVTGVAQWRIRDVTMVAPAALEADSAGGSVRAPITGMVISLEVTEGQRVERGQVLATLEAMKMQHIVMAPVAGLVGTVAIAEGAQISARDLIVEIIEEGA
ncbi:acetyl/propionyl/methylcrotonyl-CoA carboxylase subunit alpha [Tianweitania sediminis]|uniref:Acetyl-CoA carboxylase biotin carboxylase subunit n=1 Tax=Tianweitania sediminis TaxID=1502156 RepID=A0A8J7UI65_9HYPH|nr:acetyl-CoA carboxylase biotin carboxylase subunit [Tianweitania sediminis]MBP0439939.1 acetyl-CoA carboxylase biotin carboxylase subunit [Tianweitania sediminis]